ncbi:MAG: serine/threonine-protein phosphatase [Ruminococcus sp.]|nr:serine/threonine-protein phosphatase [Ruminococcus sp.]
MSKSNFRFLTDDEKERQHAMRSYHIEYGCVSSVGKIRKNNEDNFYADAHIREEIDSVDDAVVSGEVRSDSNECFAVFDGMGGEALGEVASFVAASHTADFLKDKDQFEEYIYELSEILNQKVAEETQARSLVLMGTTAAMVQFAQNAVYILNAGDSRVYRLSRRELVQISVDHTARSWGGKAITKFLGMPEEAGPLSPYLAEAKYRSGDIYLLCSDGVSDMLSDEEIEEILKEKKPADAMCRDLVDKALEKGGVDNTTAIVCKVKLF